MYAVDKIDSVSSLKALSLREGRESKEWLQLKGEVEMTGMPLREGLNLELKGSGSTSLHTGV